MRARVKHTMNGNGDRLAMPADADWDQRIYTNADSTFFLPLRLRMDGEDFTRPYEQNAWVYAAARATSGALSNVPMVVKRGRRNDPTDTGDAVGEEDPLQRVFQSPNPAMTGSQLTEAISVHLDIDGEALVLAINEVGGGYDPTRPPKELWVVSEPKSYEAHVKNGVVVEWSKETQKGRISLPATQIIHFKLYNPHDTYRGLSPLRSAFMELNGDHKASQFNQAFLDQGADPGGVLMTDMDLTEAQKQSVRVAWEARHKGRFKRGRMAILEGGLKYEPIVVDHTKMQFLGQREWTREEVLAVLRVPKLEVGLIDDVNRATATVVKRMWWQNVLIPRLGYMEDVWWSFLFRPLADSGRGMILFPEYDLSDVEALKEDFTEKLEHAESLHRIGYSLNKINERLDLGMEEAPWGDEALTDAGKVPISVIIAPDAEADGEIVEDAYKEEASRGNNSIVDPISRNTPTATTAPAPNWADEWNRVFRRPGEKVVLASVQKAYRSIGRAQMSRFDSWLSKRTHERDSLPPISKKDVDAFLLPHKEWKKEVERHLGKPFEKVTFSALMQLDKEMGGFAQIDINIPQKWLKDYGLRRVASMVRVTKRERIKLRQQIVRGITQGGWDTRKLRDHIKQHMTMLSTTRADLIARTETGILSSEIRNEGMKREGVKKTKWTTARDDHVRPEDEYRPVGDGNHRALEGEVVDLGKKFANGLRFPMDPFGKAVEVINCRCVAVPVVED